MSRGYYYKILLRPEGPKMVSIAFLIPQLGTSDNIQDYIVTVNTVETMTKLDFFPRLMILLKIPSNHYTDLKSGDSNFRLMKNLSFC